MTIHGQLENSVAPTPPTPVAIIGMGCLFPKADGLDRYWANIRDGIDAITEVPETHWRPEDYFDADPKAPDRTYARRGGFLSPVDFPALEFGIAPNNLDATDTTQLLGLLVARLALEDAGYGGDRPFNRDRTSVILGVTGTLELVIPLGARLGHPVWRRALKAAGVPDDTAETVVQQIADSYVGWQENSFPGLLGNVAAGRIANRLDLGGTNCVIDAACASSLGALNLALLELATGRSDMVLTGGLDTFNDIFMYMCFSKTPALSPSGNARPFDASADGTILGEGLGVLVLKRLEDARRDGDRVYAVIRSVGSSSDGKGSAVYAPKAEGQAKALRQTYSLAGVTADTIGLVEAHGTGTKVGDAVELGALTNVFREAKAEGSWCTLGSVKSQIGHTKAAAGVAGLIKAALALHHKVLPPTAKVERPVETLASGASPFSISTQARPWLPSNTHPRRAAVSAFGFGGSNFHCLLEEAEPTLAAIDWDGDVQIVAFSAASADQLRASLDTWPQDLPWKRVCVEAAQTRARFRSGDPHRLLMVIERTGDVARRFADARALLESSALKSFAMSPDGIFVGRGPSAGRLAFLFPGQGSQYVGMLRDLACAFPAFQDALVSANQTGSRFSDPIYPPTAFSDQERTRQDEALRATEVAQPAIGAVSLGCLEVLRHFGVTPDAVAGHSFGELTALCAAGCVTPTDFHTLAHHRGRLMGNRAGDRGAMLAVAAPLEVIEQVLRDEHLALVIANKNAPRQAILSGPSDTITRAGEVFTSREISTRALPVSSAFHSEYVADASEPLLDVLRSVEFHASTIPVYSNTTAGRYPTDLNEARRLLAYQLAKPVEFVNEIEALYQAGMRTFVEVGPDHKLTGLVDAILEGREHLALAVDASRGRRGNVWDLAKTLAAIAAQGYNCELPRWQEGVAERIGPVPEKPGLMVKVSGANLTRPRPEPPKRTTPPPETKPQTTRPESPATMTSRPSRNGKHSETAMTHENGTTHSSPKKTLTPERVAAPSTPSAPALAPIPLGSSDPALLSQALKNVQDNLVALQKLSAQTADVHRQFLEGQDKAQHSFQILLEQQQRLTLAGLGVSPPATPAIAPPPRVQSPRFERQPTPITPPSAPNRQPLPRKPTPPAPAAPPAVIVEAKPAAVAASDPRVKIGKVLVDVVAEKTGYPAEMLEPSMQLDADLGIDSIKRVEILSALQERLPDAPVIKPEHLGTLRTLGDIINFLGEGADSGAVTTEDPASDVSFVQDALIAVVAEKTGYPAEMLEPTMQLDADLGIDSIKRVEILSALQERLPEAPVIKPEHLGTLRTLGDIIEFLSDGKPKQGAVPSKNGNGYHVPNGRETALVAEPKANGHLVAEDVQRLVLTRVPLRDNLRDETTLPPGAEFWVIEDGSGLGNALQSGLELRGARVRVVFPSEAENLPKPEQLDGLILLGSARDAFPVLQRASTGLQAAGESRGSWLVSVSRLDGAFGMRHLAPGTAATDAGLAGLVKTAAHEWPDVQCKAIDLDPAYDKTAGADAVLNEILRRGPREVALSPGGHSTLELNLSPLNHSSHLRPLHPGDVVIISGGARGVTAEVAVVLAEAFQPTIVLLGRSPEPEREPEWLASLDGEAEIKKGLAKRANGHATPHVIGEQFRNVAAGREIAQTLRRIEAAGGRAVYRSVDVRDSEAVRAQVDAIRNQYGPIRGLIHGAGVLADRRIEDQTEDQFAFVYDTKVSGLSALLEGVGRDELKAIVMFSSSTARFGRTGQVAYAAANEVLNKVAQREAQARPGCRVLSINWGPWDGGMVTSALKPLFQAEGIGLIPTRAGAHYLVEELQNGESPSPVEIVILGPGSQPVSHPQDPPRRDAHSEVAAPALPVVFQVSVGVDSLPILRSHIIDGRPVLPMALALEWLAQGALQRNPGLTFVGVDDLRLLKGIVVADARPEVVRICAGKAVRQGTDYVVPVELRGTLTDGRDVVHVRGEVVLGDRLPTGVPAIGPLDLVPYSGSAGEVYRKLLFHGKKLHGIELVDGCGEWGVCASVSTAPSPTEWIENPHRKTWLSDPLAIDCAFQLLIVWSVERFGAGSLPVRVGNYRQFRRAFPASGVRVVARVTEANERKAISEIEFIDAEGGLVARMDDYECVIAASLNDAFRRNQAIPSAPR